MSNPYLSRVQQKMTHSSMALEACRHSSATQLREANLQAAVLHLAIACRLYLREVAHSLQVPMPERIYTPQDLVDMSGGGIGTEELVSRSFIASLFATEQSLLNPSVGAPQVIAGAGSAGMESLELEGIESWQTELVELIERQRQSFLEY